MKKIYLITILSAILSSCGSNQIPEGSVGIYKSESMSGMFLGKNLMKQQIGLQLIQRQKIR